METATLPTRPTLTQALLRGLVRSAALGHTPQEHLHFDRTARAWRAHEEREPHTLSAPTFQECA